LYTRTIRNISILFVGTARQGEDALNPLTIIFDVVKDF
jgi:hypothetical protein